jgi:branched-chain amino acid transport system ATP-binding protein
MLRVENLEAGYNIINILKKVKLKVEEKQIVCILGPNGSGKSTLLKTICGTLPCNSGKIYFDNYDITNFPSHKKAKLGIILVPERRGIFAEMTAYENLILGFYPIYKKIDKTKKQDRIEMVMDLFPILRERRNQIAGTLSGGEQQMLAIGRGLMSYPKILMLDEPSLGLAPLIIENIFSTLINLRNKGQTLLIVEENAHKALTFSDYTYVLKVGEVVLEGESRSFLNKESIINAYLSSTS